MLFFFCDRGNSKYHYYGIRVKPGSALTGQLEDNRSPGTCMQNSNATAASGKGNHGSGRYKRNSENFDPAAPLLSQHHGYLGEGSGAIPEFPEIHFSQPLPDDCSMEDVDTLR